MLPVSLWIGILATPTAPSIVFTAKLGVVTPTHLLDPYSSRIHPDVLDAFADARMHVYVEECTEIDEGSQCVHCHF